MTAEAKRRYAAMEDLVAVWPASDWVSEDTLASRLADRGHDVTTGEAGEHLFQGAPLRQLLSIARRQSKVIRDRHGDPVVYTRPVPGVRGGTVR